MNKSGRWDQIKNERQTGTVLENILDNHLQRYLWAKKILTKRGLTNKVLDIGCGIGYGSSVLAESVKRVDAVDISYNAEELYNKHYKRDNIKFIVADAFSAPYDPPYDAVVCFEVIEHIKEDDMFLDLISRMSRVLLSSVPNENNRPWASNHPFHFRHYTPDQYLDLLFRHGYGNVKGFHQVGERKKNAVVRKGIDGGNTIVSLALRTNI